MTISWKSTPTFCAAFLPQANFNKKRLAALAEALVDNPYTPERFMGVKMHDGLMGQVEGLAAGKSWLRLELDWELPKTRDFWRGRVTQARVATMREEPGLPMFSGAPGQAFLAMWTWNNIADPTIGDRPVFLAGWYRRGLNALDADFGFLDHFGKNIFRDEARGVDLRGLAWGAMYYGPKLVGEIGMDRLESCPAHLVEREPNGAYWVQLAENPFKATAVQKRKAAQHMRLAELFHDAAGPRQLPVKEEPRIRT